jgi:hypothetical protein
VLAGILAPAGPAAANVPAGTTFTVASGSSRAESTPATNLRVRIAGVVSPLADGSFLLPDGDLNRIVRIDLSGGARLVAGGGHGPGGPSGVGDGGPASEATLRVPHEVAPLPGGGYLIADSFESCIRRVDQAGRIATVAGSCHDQPDPSPAQYTGDGGPATGADLSTPDGIALQSDGGFLIADADHAAIRRVAPDGTISTVAGGLGEGHSGDGGPATGARLAYPSDVASLPDGGFLIADTHSNLIRRVSPDGTITTVAGRPAQDTRGGFSGDGGPAVEAKLAHPAGVTPLAGGGFLIADSENNRIRRVDGAGRIRTVAGGGNGGNGSRATRVRLIGANGVAVARDGGLLISESERVRYVTPRHPELLAVGFAAVKTRARRRIRLRVSATGGGPAKIRVRRRGKVLRRVRRRLHAGRTVVRMHAPRRRGRYVLIVSLRSGRRVAIGRARLIVK